MEIVSKPRVVRLACRMAQCAYFISTIYISTQQPSKKNIQPCKSKNKHRPLTPIPPKYLKFSRFNKIWPFDDIFS